MPGSDVPDAVLMSQAEHRTTRSRLSGGGLSASHRECRPRPGATNVTDTMCAAPIPGQMPDRCPSFIPSFNRSRQSRGAHLTPWRNPRARRHRQSVWQDRRTSDLPVGFVELGQMPTRVRCEEGKFFHTPDLRSESGRHPDGVVAGCTTGHTRAATDSHAPGCRPPSAVPRATELRHRRRAN